ncbi:transcriptional repressor LexA [Desulfosoma caldarium]|uniref:LexA repressor n=1 Tax=Desulfosoma caldarium TaxID=610254 RepID=A0A3N1ULN0_9BACT|nr:transcriptional repressor LexA [Desulfosoma caldarium]ROQ89610.1 repressor LexA [Desulfosoma caldarium]
MKLTAAQKRVYDFLQAYMILHGHAPSYEEIRKHLGFRSLNAVYKHVKQLEERGYVRSLGKNRKRALELVELRSGGRSVPFLGVVAAGTPIEAVEVPETVEVPESLLAGGEHFALRVRGDSMIDEGIREGDILIVKKQPTAENGQTVVALVDGEATVKRFFLHDTMVELRPANRAMASLMVPADSVSILGVVVGLVRHYRHRLGL